MKASQVPLDPLVRGILCRVLRGLRDPRVTLDQRGSKGSQGTLYWARRAAPVHLVTPGLLETPDPLDLPPQTTLATVASQVPLAPKALRGSQGSPVERDYEVTRVNLASAERKEKNAMVAPQVPLDRQDSLARMGCQGHPEPREILAIKALQEAQAFRDHLAPPVLQGFQV